MFADPGPAPPFVCIAGKHKDHPGWWEWRLPDQTRFNAAVLGLSLVRPEGDKARFRIFPEHHLTNINNNIHGGVVMALIDIAMFAGASVLLQKDLGLGLTVEVHNHFVGPGDSGRPLDALVEVVKEAGRLVFLRGTVVQEDHIVSSFSGIIRKPSRP